MASAPPFEIPLEERSGAACNCQGEGSSGQPPVASARQRKYGVYFSIIMMVGFIAFVAVKPGTAESVISLDLECIQKRLSAGDSSTLHIMIGECEMANGRNKITKAMVDKFMAARPMSSPARSLPKGRFSRHDDPKMSHLTHIKLLFKDRDVLKKSLEQMGMTVNVQENANTPLQVLSQQGHMENVDLVAKADNGYDIGFAKNGETYELVTDISFWQQPIEKESSTSFWYFLDWLKQIYAVNSIITHSEQDGFQIEEMVKNEDGSVKVNLKRSVADGEFVPLR